MPSNEPRITVEAALRDLTSPKATTRADAAWDLDGAALTDASLVLALRGALGDPSPEVRRAAAFALAGAADAPTCEALSLAATADPDGEVRQAAVVALGRRGSEGGVAAVRRALADPDPDVRFQATAVVVALDPGNAAPALAPLLEDADAEVRGSAAAALGDLGAREHSDPLRGRLHDADEGVQLEAAVALARLGDASGVEVLLAHLRRRDTRLLAAEHLFLVAGPDHLAPLLQHARAARFDPLLRVWLAGAAARLGDAASQQELLAALDRRNPLVHGVAVRIVEAIDAPWARERAASLGGPERALRSGE